MLKVVNVLELEKTSIGKDMGVNVDNQLKFINHIEMQVNKGNKILGLIRRSFTYPRYEKDKKLIEGVQRRVTKMVQEPQGQRIP